MKGIGLEFNTDQIVVSSDSGLWDLGNISSSLIFWNSLCRIDIISLLNI